MSTQVVVSFAVPEQCDALASVIAQVIDDIPYYNQLARVTEIQKFTAAELRAKLAADPFSVIVATDNAAIIGFCLSRFDDYTIWLEWFGVVQPHRGGGLSHQLLQKLESTVHLRQCHKIWCDCRTSNNASIHILKAHGYQQLVTLTNHWYGQDFILWEKQIG